MWEYGNKIGEYLAETVREYKSKIVIGACSVAMTLLFCSCTEFSKGFTEGVGGEEYLRSLRHANAQESGYDPSLELGNMKLQMEEEKLKGLQKQQELETIGTTIHTRKMLIEGQMRR